MKIPANFNPVIPPRGTKEFALYAADVMRRWAEGEVMVSQYLLKNMPGWDGDNSGICDWHTCNYAILPAPEPEKITWLTYEQGCQRITDLGGHEVLICRIGDTFATTGRLHISNIDKCVIPTYSLMEVDSDNYHLHEASLDGGKTWRSPGWVRSLDDAS